MILDLLPANASEHEVHGKQNTLKLGTRVEFILSQFNYDDADNMR